MSPLKSQIRHRHDGWLLSPRLLQGVCARVFLSPNNKNVNLESVDKFGVGQKERTCLWWRTCRCWHSQNSPASSGPLRINSPAGHPLGQAACILGTKAEGRSDWSYSSGSENLREGRSEKVTFCVLHASRNFFRVFSLPRPSCLVDPCWCHSQCRRTGSLEKEILFQGKKEGLNLGECFSQGLPSLILSLWHLLSLLVTSFCPSALKGSPLYFLTWLSSEMKTL